MQETILIDQPQAQKLFAGLSLVYSDTGVQKILAKKIQKTLNRHRFHGDPTRFQIVAEYIADNYDNSIKYIADVAGGQGMLARLLTKKYHYTCEVVDPRGWVLKGVKNQAQEFDPSFASYYDLIVGLHPDEAIRAVAQAALIRPAILIPCCNFWSEDKLGREALLQAIETFYQENSVQFQRVEFPFMGPKNIGLVSTPPLKRK